MGEIVKYTGLEFMLHGSGVANCSSWPRVWVSFDIEFERRDPDHPEKVTFTMKNANMVYGQKTGTFGFQLYAYIGFDSPSSPTIDDIWTIAEKTTNDGSYWWNKFYAYNRTGTFTSTSNEVKIRIYVKNRSNCWHGDYIYCFNDPGTYCLIHDITRALPTLDYTVTYDAAGGTNAPAPQKKNSLTDLTITSDIPEYPVTIRYFNNDTVTPTDTVTAYRNFDYWYPQAHQDYHYLPNNSYGVSTNPPLANEDVTLYAHWGDATFTPIDIPDKYVTVTFDPNGGTVMPTSTAILRTETGYNTGAGTAVICQPGVSATTSTDLDLYPVYGDATLALADIPIPTREGYRFSGWYEDEALTYKIIDVFRTSTDATIYAKWTKLPINQFNINGEWKGNSQYVWQMNAASGSDPRGWYKTAPIYGFDGVEWIDLSEGIQPKGIFNAMGVTGLLPEFAEGVEYAKQQSGTPTWQITQDKIYYTLNGQGNSRTTLGGQLRKSFYKYLCVDADASGVVGRWNASQFGIRYVANGKGGTNSGDVSNVRIVFTLYVNGNPGQTLGYNYLDSTIRESNVEPYWYYIPRTVTKLDLSTVTQEPFYLTMHACDCGVNIYRIWLE